MTSCRARLAQFSETLSVIGAVVVFDVRASTARRVIWSLLITAGVVGCSISIVQSVATYLTFPLTVAIEVKEQAELQMPHVAVCSKQPLLKMFQRRGSNESRAVEVLTAAIKAGVGCEFNDGEKRKCLNQEFPHDSDLPMLTSEILSIIGQEFSDESQAELMRGGFKMKPRQYEMGSCIAFEGKRTIIGSGMSKKLKITISSNVTEAIYPLYDAHIFFINIYDHYEPISYNHGRSFVVATTGTQTLVGIQKRELRRYNVPWDPERACLHEEAGVRYSRVRCLKNCITDRMMKRCECALPNMIYNRTAQKECTTQRGTACAALETSQAVTKQCDCPTECREVRYDLAASTVPMDRVSDPPALRVEVFFKSREMEVITQSPAYTELSLLADIGGTLGLFLGSALLTVAQLLDFGLSSLCSTVGPRCHREKLAGT